MKKGVVSVILPIYNVEKYLNRCIESIINQTYSKLEIILVDDESPDNCPQICDEWAKKDSRIKVIHKKNQGLGYARNTGIENANGEYICFFDSDDYIALNTIEECYTKAIQYSADIVTYGFYRVSSNGKILKKYIPNVKKNFFEGKEIQTYILPNMIAPNTVTGEITNLWMSMCGALFSTKMINHLNWRLVSERDIISEDIFSLLRLYKNVEKVVVISEAYYYYCENYSSLTHKYKEDRFERNKYFYKECLNMCDELKYNEEIKKRLMYPFISNTIATIKMIVNANLLKEEKEKALNNIINDKIFSEVLAKTDIRKEKITRKIFIVALRYRMIKFCKVLIKIKH